MRWGTVRILLGLALFASLAGGARPATPAALASGPALGLDVCPEPNDEFQAACSVGPSGEVLGFISSPKDVDAYRFDTLDFDSHAQVTLSDLPFPYEALIADWRGEIIATSSATDDGRQRAEAMLRLPGTYYAFVHARNGELSDNRPYRLAVSVDYDGRPLPRLLYQGDYLAGVSNLIHSQPGVDLIEANGKLSVVTKEAGTLQSRVAGYWTLELLPSDFSFVMDTRVPKASQAGFDVTFGVGSEPGRSYVLGVDATNGRATLELYTNDGHVTLADWHDVSSIDRLGGVNRVIVQSADGEVLITVNGGEAARVGGQTVAPGILMIAGVSWGDPTTISFDNVLITAPGGGPATGTVQFTDSFDASTRRLIGTGSSAPEKHEYSYLDGEYRMRQLTPGGLSVQSIPGIYDDLSLAVSARLVDVVDQPYLSISCRTQAVSRGSSEYRLTVVPAFGRYKLVRWDNAAETPLVDWKTSDAIQRGDAVNRLELVCVGSTITARANDQDLTSVQDATYPRGRLSFGVGVFSDQQAPADARFDDLVLMRR